MKKHSDTGTDIDALEDIFRPIYAEVYAKHNVYVLSVAWKGNDFFGPVKYSLLCTK
jgi:hypothetical protein